ncbi:hypothetical protein [Xylophilus sp. GOD-11R]|uniref:hypothetical protein n=1 Tax=Xylophilus sp. GOD-11R TaxID=3089814 RepID=UPI00298C9CDB|nr:hypothetical protein [Xylophilus sp. GOD-11R]WPB58216.1 hypothetical protein R9X41_06130 [Xylophilus sp. GOD-11R]
MGFAASSVSSSFTRADRASGFDQERASWLAPLSDWMRRRLPPSRPSLRGTAQPGQRIEPDIAAPATGIVVPSRQRPLPVVRVLRVADGAPRQCAGRMVISGRMADVCAELDRLAAAEVQRRGDHRRSAN